MNQINARQIEILQHALGLDQYGRGVSYRNHFCAGKGDEPDCQSLVDLGLMRKHATTQWLPYFNCSVTEAGRRAVVEQSPAPPKRTRSQLRWARFVDSGASDCGITFREWLKIDAERQRGIFA